MSLWEPDEVYTVECEDCGKPKRPFEMKKSEKGNICIECSAKEIKDWDDFFKEVRRRCN